MKSYRCCFRFSKAIITLVIYLRIRVKRIYESFANVPKNVTRKGEGTWNFHEISRFSWRLRNVECRISRLFSLGAQTIDTTFPRMPRDGYKAFEKPFIVLPRDLRPVLKLRADFRTPRCFCSRGFEQVTHWTCNVNF